MDDTQQLLIETPETMLPEGMKPEIKQVPLKDILFDQALYPRKEHDPQLVQKYSECLDEIQARGNFMSVAADMTLLDGRHRHLAHLKKADGDNPVVTVFVYPIANEDEKYALALELNSTHGAQLSQDDKRSGVLRLFSQYQWPIEVCAKKVGVRKQTALEWTKTIREEQERRQNERIFDMWLACYTQEEIAEATGTPLGTLKDRLAGVWLPEFPGTKATKLSHFELETNSKGEEQPDEHGWKRPLYNVWTWQAKTNNVSHFGNSEQRILENLLYLYTEPFDIVLDPFAGGGSTIDVCRRRLRRYWVSDRKPIVERANEIRPLDVTQDLPPLNRRWSEVTLTYIDPPYWRQAQGKYSDDPQDLANMELAQFTEAVVSTIERIAAKQSRGAIALLMQPTQWHADNRQFTDHVTDIVRAVKSKALTLDYRISCPYTSEQCNAQMVQWAKDNRKILVLTRECIVWRF